MRLEHGIPGFVSDVLIANREHDGRTSASGVQYDARIDHPEGGWLVNKKELEYVQEKHKVFCQSGRKYPDEN
jgi:hypothetical protein